MNSHIKIKPAFSECKNCIILCANDDFMPIVAVLMQSIFENRNLRKFYDIIILHSNITSTTEKSILGMFEKIENMSVRFVNISFLVSNANFYTANRNSLTVETYYRLVAPWILHEEYEKALYLDGDMIAIKDIYSVFDFDIGDNLIGAMRDYWGICNCYIPGDLRKEYRESIGLGDIDNYVIACTTLFNLKKFRTTFTLDDIINLSVCREWQQHDQDVLNILCKDSIYYLSAEWGLMTDWGNNHYLPQALLDELNSINDPVLIHFGGSRKPWKSAYQAYDLDFWKYADCTPYLSTLLNRITSQEYKGYVAYKLSEGNIFKYCDGKDVYRAYKGVSLGKLSQCHTRYRSIKIIGNMLHLEGMVGFWAESFNSIISVFFEINGEMIPACRQNEENGYIKERKEYTYRGEVFELDYELSDNIFEYDIKIICQIDGITVEKTNLGFEKFSPLNRKFKNCYYHTGKWIVSTDKKILIVKRASKKLLKKYEKMFCCELWKSNIKANRKAILVRRMIFIIKKLIKKPIWLVSDRVAKGDDNGEAFFKYLNKRKRRKVRSYYILSKNSPDYKRISKYGKIVEPYSYKHKLLHLLAEYSISSQTDDIYRNPFGVFKEPYRDLLSDVKFVFLQHGIISNDLSDWLQKRRQNLTGFVCTTEREQAAIINGNYGYDHSVVWLTGLPRFDLLEDKREKIITILPTWRMYLAVNQDKETGLWNVVNNFAETNYAKFYRSLLHNERLSSLAKKMGYVIQIKIHPSFLQHADKFEFDETVNIIKDDVSYREIYSKSSLIVTDYSSSVYDFLYMGKPIIYTQFDCDEFFSGKHIYNKGEFDYEREGFGEVVYDLESTIDMIIEYMKNDCQLKENYRKRIDDFFEFRDKNNCQRVYEKIKGLIP